MNSVTFISSRTGNVRSECPAKISQEDLLGKHVFVIAVWSIKVGATVELLSVIEFEILRRSSA